jgi:hypothetical protein
VPVIRAASPLLGVRSMESAEFERRASVKNSGSSGAALPITVVAPSGSRRRGWRQLRASSATVSSSGPSVTCRPSSPWAACTAVSVAGPKTPSTVRSPNPLQFSRNWMASTVSLLSPCTTSGVPPGTVVSGGTVVVVVSSAGAVVTVPPAGTVDVVAVDWSGAVVEVGPPSSSPPHEAATVASAVNSTTCRRTKRRIMHLPCRCRRTPTYSPMPPTPRHLQSDYGRAGRLTRCQPDRGR